VTKPTITQLIVMAAAAGALYFLGHVRAASVLGALTAVVLILAFLAPAVLETLQQAAARIASWVSSGIGLCLLTVLYFSIFLAGSVLLRLRSIDLLNRSFPSRGKSNWIDRIGYGKDKLLYKKPYTRPHFARDSKGSAE
jgi:hypothetical protein